MEKQETNSEQDKEVSTQSDSTLTVSSLIKDQPSFHNDIQIGLVNFQTGIPKKTVDRILKDFKKKIIHTQKWTIQNSNRSQQKWKQFFQVVKIARNTSLSLYDTNFPTILTTIRHIEFQNLTYLNLQCNNVSNIESLSFINAANLRKLDLSGNHITQSKALNKILFKNLNYIELCDNPLLETDLGRLKCNQDKCYFRLMTHPYTKVFQNINFFVKLEKNVVPWILSQQMKYYSGESTYGDKHIKVLSNEKIIVQKKSCQSIKRKLTFQRQW